MFTKLVLVDFLLIMQHGKDQKLLVVQLANHLHSGGQLMPLYQPMNFISSIHYLTHNFLPQDFPRKFLLM